LRHPEPEEGPDRHHRFELGSRLDATHFRRTEQLSKRSPASLKLPSSSQRPATHSRGAHDRSREVAVADGFAADGGGNSFLDTLLEADQRS
jgi:hypothetical protein